MKDKEAANGREIFPATTEIQWSVLDSLLLLSTTWNPVGYFSSIYNSVNQKNMQAVQQRSSLICGSGNHPKSGSKPD